MSSDDLQSAVDRRASPGRPSIIWIDILGLVFLAALAVLPPIREPHKQLTLLAIGAFQLLEGRLIARLPSRGPAYSVLIKILLATLLIGHTGEVGINSSYYPIYYLPVISAAMYFGPWGTIFWTVLASTAYLSYLFPALLEYELTEGAATELAIRNLFIFLAAIVVNRFVMESRRQATRYQRLAETLAETNLQLQQAQAEARRSERLAALGQLSAGLAHEIRNPLAVIKGSAEMLSQKLESANPLGSELAGYISSEVNRLNAMVGRFLDFARPVPLDLQRQNLPPILDRALKVASDRFPDAKVRVERQFDASLPAIPVDADLCEQVFTNLFLNAYEAMPEGGTLRVAATTASSDGRQGVEVVCEDSGPGVAPEFREQIFNPFFTTKKTGTGLGLSIVSKIVDEHHGWMRLEDKPGTGARFRLFFPER